MRACPFCAEAIQEAAVKCRFCGSEVQAVALLPSPAPAVAPSPAQTAPAVTPAPPQVVKHGYHWTPGSILLAFIAVPAVLYAALIVGVILRRMLVGY